MPGWWFKEMFLTAWWPGVKALKHPMENIHQESPIEQDTQQEFCVYSGHLLVMTIYDHTWVHYTCAYSMNWPVLRWPRIWTPLPPETSGPRWLQRERGRREKQKTAWLHNYINWHLSDVEIVPKKRIHLQIYIQKVGTVRQLPVDRESIKQHLCLGFEPLIFLFFFPRIEVWSSNQQQSSHTKLSIKLKKKNRLNRLNNSSSGSATAVRIGGAEVVTLLEAIVIAAADTKCRGKL